MTTPSEELRALLADLLAHVDRETCTHEETHRGGAIWTICDSCGKSWADDRGGFVPHEDASPVAAARAALARQEEGREAVATVVSFTNGSYHRNYRLTWHRDVPAGTQLFVHADSGKDEEVFTHSQSECDSCGGMVACPRCDVEHPAPHSGEGERAAFEAWARPRWRHPEDFDPRIVDRTKYNNIMVQAAWEAWQQRATPAPQAADITAIAELREIMADESGEREALLVSFFRTTGAAMGRHGDAMGWAPEQTARHYLSEASK